MAARLHQAICFLINKQIGNIDETLNDLLNHRKTKTLKSLVKRDSNSKMPKSVAICAVLK